MRTLEKRLSVLEAQTSGPDGFEVWIGGDDDRELLGPNGETMSRAEFDERYPDAINIGAPGGHDEER